MRSYFGRIAVSLMAFVLLAPSMVHGDGGPDATTGLDAPNSPDLALALPSFGTYVGVALPYDADWYAISSAASAPTCVATTYAGSMRGTITQTVNSSDGLRTVTMRTNSGASIAMAAPSLSSVVDGIVKQSGGTTAYTFDISSIGLPDALAGDAGTTSDAGSTPGSALAVNDGCLGGTFGLTDVSDVYSLTASDGDEIVYSLATTASGVHLDLTDASGTPIAPQIQPGQFGSYFVSGGGTYYLRATSDAAMPSAYLVGLSSGSEPSGCRPYCVSTAI